MEHRTDSVLHDEKRVIEEQTAGGPPFDDEKRQSGRKSHSQQLVPPPPPPPLIFRLPIRRRGAQLRVAEGVRVQLQQQPGVPFPFLHQAQ